MIVSRSVPATASSNLTYSASILTVTGSVIATSFTGSLQGTSSWAINALTASSADTFLVRNNTTISGSLVIYQNLTD